MKFLLIVLAIHFGIEVVNSKRKNRKMPDEGNSGENTRHPAEYQVR